MTPDRVLALTLWGEARGEGVAGMTGVGCVVMNRVRHPRWWGTSVRTVCLHKDQFSCWNADDPNRSKMLTLSTENEVFKEALFLATRLIAGTIHDTTGNADSYVNLNVDRPDWIETATQTVVIGHHTFFRVEL